MALEKKYYSGSQVFDIIKELPDKEFLSLLNAFAKEHGADVVERKTGKWLWVDGVRCSNCNHKLQTTGLPSVCPNCGAKMDGKETEDDND